MKVELSEILDYLENDRESSTIEERLDHLHQLNDDRNEEPVDDDEIVKLFHQLYDLYEKFSCGSKQSDRGSGKNDELKDHDQLKKSITKDTSHKKCDKCNVQNLCKELTNDDDPDFDLIATMLTELVGNPVGTILQKLSDSDIKNVSKIVAVILDKDIPELNDITIVDEYIISTALLHSGTLNKQDMDETFEASILPIYNLFDKFSKNPPKKEYIMDKNVHEKCNHMISRIHY